MSAPGPSLEVRGLGVRGRGGRELLGGVSFSVGRGEVLGVIGPNGAGKTTLLEAIAGLREAAGGEVAFGGRRLASFAERARVFAYMPDDARLPPELSVRAVLGGALDDAALGPLGLGALGGANAGRLSRGEAQRVWLGWALAQKKPVLLLDEPFGAFDPRQLREVLPVVRAAAAGGVSVLVTVHQMRSAELAADRLLLLAGGRALALGTLDELRRRAGLAGAPLDDVFLALLEAGGGDRAAP